MQVTIDLGSAETEKDIHALLKESLSFPDYYGYNLDALYDVLLDPHEYWDISFTNCRHLWETKALYMEELKATFMDAIVEGASLRTEWYA